VLPEPVAIELDRPRRLRFNLEALMLAEREINRRRGVRPAEYVNIEYLIISSASAQVAGTGGFALDLVMTLLWAGLRWEDKALSVDNMPALIEASPLTHGQMMTIIWDAYASHSKRKNTSTDDGAPPVEDSHPLAQRPGYNTGALQ